MGTKNKAVILARVSSKSQEDEGYSLDSQLKLLLSYCETNELRVERTFKIAETASKQQSRKVFHELLVYLKKQKIQNLVVEKTDRLTRNLKDAVSIDDWLDADSDRMLHAVKENLRLHKEAKSDVKFMWGIHLAVAKKFADNLREEAMKGWAEKLAQGWLPAVPPFGYMTIVDQGKRIHIPNPDTYKKVQKLFRLYLENGQSISTVMVRAEKIGLRTKKNHTVQKSAIELMLKNPFYIGINRFNGADYPGAQTPIITKKIFEAVQEKLHSGKPSRYGKHNPLLKSMISCTYCNGVFSWQLQKGHYYGSCQRRLAACKQNNYIREDVVVALLMDEMKRLLCPSKPVMDWVVQTLESDYTTIVETIEESKTAMQTKIKRLEAMKDMLYDDKLSGEITLEIYKRKRTEIDEQLSKVQRELDGIKATINERHKDSMTIIKLTQNAAERFNKIDIDDQRAILIELFESMQIESGVVSVKLSKLVHMIGQKCDQSRQILETLKNENRTVVNDTNNRGGRRTELVLRPVWQGHVESNHDLRFWRPVY